MNRERTPPPTTSLADHLGQVETRAHQRALFNFVGTELDYENGAADVKVPKVAPLRLSGPVVKVVPAARKKGIAVTMFAAGNVVRWQTAAGDWFDSVTQQARVRVGDEIVVDAIVKRVRDARGGGKFLVVTTPKLIEVRRGGTQERSR
jgi:hypothetical protein